MTSIQVGGGGGIVADIGSLIVEHEDGEPPKYHIDGGPVIWLSEMAIIRGGGTLNKSTATIGPYRFRLIERNPERRGWTAIRITGVLSYALVNWALLKKWAGIVNRRLLMTAIVWELSDTQPGQELKWSDLKILKRAKG